MPSNSFISETMITLDTEELQLIHTNNTDKNRLTFAIMLKFFQANGRYPMQKDTIEPELLYSLARQLNVSCTLFEFTHLENRTAKRFRHKIREFLGFRLARFSDAEILITWLLEQAKTEPHTLPQYRAKASQFYMANKLEPFSSKKTDRYIRAAIHRFEKQFFANIAKELSIASIKIVNNLLRDDLKENDSKEDRNKDDKITLRSLKTDVAGVKLKHVAFEIKKLNFIRSIPIPSSLFDSTPRKLPKKYYQRIMAASPSNILEFVPNARAASMACFIYIRSQLLTDDAADLFIKLIHNMKSSAEVHVNKKIISDVKKVNGKFDILCLLADTALDNPEGIIKETIYPKVGEQTLKNLVTELKTKGNRWYQNQVNLKVHSLYSHAHRKSLLQLLNAFTFKTNSLEGRDLLDAIAFIKQHQDSTDKYYPDTALIPTANVIPNSWKSMVFDTVDFPVTATAVNDAEKHAILTKINRFHYEIAVLESLREKLRCKLIWIEGAYRYRNPDDDLPADWEKTREARYLQLGLPLKASSYCQIWCMTIRRRSCLIVRQPVLHLQTLHC